jgi:APA family basic amino acid/polyamine antiporter
MAEDGCLPAWLRYPQQGPPRAAILFQTALALVLLWSFTFIGLLTYIGFTLGLCTAGAVMGLIRLRLREGPAMRVPGWPWAPGIFLLTVLASALFAMVRQPAGSAIGLGTIMFGLAAWRFVHGRRGGSGLA